MVSGWLQDTCSAVWFRGCTFMWMGGELQTEDTDGQAQGVPGTTSHSFVCPVFLKIPTSESRIGIQAMPVRPSPKSAHC